MHPEAALARLVEFRLLDLMTFKRSGDSVTTPVRFAVESDRVLVSLQAGSGKVKRIRANSRVRIAGHNDADRLDGKIRLLEGPESHAAYAALKRRYPMLTIQRFTLGRHPTRHVSAEITLSS